MQRRVKAFLLSCCWTAAAVILSLSQGCSDGARGNTTGSAPAAAPATDMTVAGIDADHDGVRDDVQQYIAATYPSSAMARSALTQYAKAVQISFINATTATTATDHEPTMIRAAACAAVSLGDSAHQALAAIDARMANTADRVRAQLAYEKKLDGKTFNVPPLVPSALCDTDPATLQN